MGNAKDKFVIIGNGIGGLTAAEEIRKANSNASITIISQENYLTYYRMRLSHSLSKEPAMKELLLHDENWYIEKDIEVILSKRVERIDLKNKKAIMEDGNEVSYDKLLIANGSTPFMPPVPGRDKQGVYSLRTLKDLNEIQEYLRDCKEVAVIGGGLLGIEAAWALKEKGLKVNILQHTGYLLGRQLDKELADYVKGLLEKEGLKVHVFAAAQELTGDQKVSGIKTEDNRLIDSDMVLFSTGVRPNVEIAKGTNLEVNRGIIANEKMQTSVEDVYVAGDIAEVKNSASGLWTIAMEQGKVAGKNMAGVESSYVPTMSATYLSVGNISLFSAGKVGEELIKVSYREGDVFHRLFVEDGKLVGGVLIGDTKKMIKLKKAVNEKVEINDMVEKGLNALEILNQL